MAAVYRINDVSKFLAVDACSLLNVCASKTFLDKSVGAGFEYNIPGYALYEAVYKPLKKPNKLIEDQRSFILKQISKGKINQAKLTLDDLQEMLEIEKSKPNLGKGELACIVYSKNKPLAVLTDDKTARNYIKKILGENKAYETAEMIAYMVFNHLITDGEFQDIINEEKESKSNMDGPYSAAYQFALMGALYEK